METQPQEEFNLPKNSYAAFDAISLRNLILTRLNDQNIFTDQNYIGSNLASIIDIISYAYNTLLFYLHKTSTETTFTEAQLYENISKIVKLLDYKPIGFQTLAFTASATSAFQAGTYSIPRYSYLTIGNIPFSFNEDISFAVPVTYNATELTDVSNKKLLYQGIYRENPLYTAAGDINETVIINNPNTFIDHFNIDVYVYENKKQKWVQYKNVPTLYTESNYAKVFEKRLNSSQLYEVVFGDNINGRRLEAGDKVAIFYLQSLGDQGVIGPFLLQESDRNLYTSITYSQILQDTNFQQLTYLDSVDLGYIRFENPVGSTIPKPIESVDSIRNNAPANFKSQYRLVTTEDYATFVRTNFANFIADVRVFNNWEYTGSYLKYFHDIDIGPSRYKQILLNHVLYADSCNFNNVYICAIPKVSRGLSLKYLLPAQKEIILSNIQPLKSLTSEIVFLDPVFKSISLGLRAGEAITIDDRYYCKLRITKAPNSKRSDKSIVNDVVAVFEEYFNPANIQLGKTFDYSTLSRNLLSITGLGKLETYRIDTNESYNGLSLYMWNPTYQELDQQVVTSNVEMKGFELYYFDDLGNLSTNIEVVEESFGLQ
jgi:hypothetical protein